MAEERSYDLLLKGGHVIDPTNRIDRVMDVAIAADKIVRVAPGVPLEQARKVLDVRTMRFDSIDSSGVLDFSSECSRAPQADRRRTGDSLLL